MLAARAHVCGKEMTIPKHERRASSSEQYARILYLCGKNDDALLKQLTATFELFVNEHVRKYMCCLFAVSRDAMRACFACAPWQRQ